jgi:NhaP-type Na+/H+ or K+/H+ antiporter
VKESLLIFSFGYLAYGTGEVFHQSGIISMLTSGVVMAHYAWYSLSPQGKTVSTIAFQCVGFGAEAFVFAYLGLSFFAYIGKPWSFEFIAIEMVIIVVGRYCGTLGLVYVMGFFGHKKLLTFRELVFIGYAGMIRGAIAFGLVLKISGVNADTKDVIVTSTITLVILTTILYGSLMGLIQKVLVPSKKGEVHEVEEEVEDVDEGEENRERNKDSINHDLGARH